MIDQIKLCYVNPPSLQGQRWSYDFRLNGQKCRLFSIEITARTIFRQNIRWPAEETAFAFDRFFPCPEDEEALRRLIQSLLKLSILQ